MTTAQQITADVEEEVVFQEQNASQRNNENEITNDGTCSLKVQSIEKYFEQCCGSLKLPVKLNSDGRITVKFIEKGKTYSQTVRYLPPINVYFKFSSNNQSKFKPVLLLHCDWLSKEYMQRIGKQLDDLWDADQGKVLHAWSAFSRSDLLKFLQIKDEIIIVTSEIEEFSSDYKDVMELLDDLLVYEPDVEKLGVIQDTSEKAWRCVESDNSKPGQEDGVDFSIENVIKEKIRAKYFLLGKHQKFLITSNSIRPFDSKLFRIDNKKPFKAADERQFDDIINKKYNLHKRKMANRITFLNKTDISFKMHSIQQYNLLVFNKLKQTCEICMDTYDGLLLCILQSCGHVFCKECMTSYVMERIETNNVGNLTCASFNCESFVYDSELKGILSDDVFLKLKQLKLKHAIYNNPELIFCPRESCESLAFLVLNGYQIIGYCYYCEFCFCIKCLKKYHGDTPCKRDGDELFLQEYENGVNKVGSHEARYSEHQLQLLRENHLSQEWIEKMTKQCPKCYVLAHKSFGCNKVVCGRCRCEFCWLCGAIVDRTYSHFQNVHNSCFQRLYDGVMVNGRTINIWQMNNVEINGNQMNNVLLNDNHMNNVPNVRPVNNGNSRSMVMDILMGPQNLALYDSYDRIANRRPINIWEMNNTAEINDNRINHTKINDNQMNNVGINDNQANNVLNVRPVTDNTDHTHMVNSFMRPPDLSFLDSNDSMANRRPINIWEINDNQMNNVEINDNQANNVPNVRPVTDNIDHTHMVNSFMRPPDLSFLDSNDSMANRRPINIWEINNTEINDTQMNNGPANNSTGPLASDEKPQDLSSLD